MRYILVVLAFLAVLLAGCMNPPCGNPDRAERMEKAHQHQ